MNEMLVEGFSSKNGRIIFQGVAKEIKVSMINVHPIQRPLVLIQITWPW